MTIGPATIIASVSTLSCGIELTKLIYVCPAKPCGIVHALFAYGTNVVPLALIPPFVNAHAVAPVAALFNVMLCPAVTACDVTVASIVIAGKGVIARLLLCGHELMNAAARVKTERTPRGVSKAEGIAALLVAVRIKVW